MKRAKSCLSETPRVWATLNSGMEQNGRNYLSFEDGNLLPFLETQPNQYALWWWGGRGEEPREAQLESTSCWIFITPASECCRDTCEAGRLTDARGVPSLQNPNMPRERPQRYWWWGKSKGRQKRGQGRNGNIISYFLLFKSIHRMSWFPSTFLLKWIFRCICHKTSTLGVEWSRVSPGSCKYPTAPARDNP